MVKGISNKPVNINKDVWFYESEKSLEFVAWANSANYNEPVCVRFRVPWKKIANTFPARAANQKLLDDILGGGDG